MEKFYWILVISIFIADLIIRMGLSLRVIMRKKEASVTLAWLVVILLLPFLGAVIYLLLGENRLGQKRAAHAADNVPLFKKWISGLEHRIQVEWNHVSPECRAVEAQARRVIGLPTLPGNKLELIDNPITFFHDLIADIDRARKSCFLEFYIWEEDGLGGKVAEAVMRAAGRGVTCKVLLDSIGSADFLQSGLAANMKRRGVEIVEALPAGIFRALFVRIDLRNHRKIAILDGEIAYTGSQNMVDPCSFKQDENIGEWIDTMVRVRGPVVEAMTATFFYDWFIESEISLEELGKIARIPTTRPAGDALVQLVPSGPGFEQGGIHDLLLTTIYAARREIIVTSPYFVPDNAILAALKSAAQRGVDVSIIVPEKNDSRLVDYASRARYGELTRSGVKILKFGEGLLHSKTITIDNDFSLIGSVNLDMRSFWLNFELTMFVYNMEFTEQLRNVQLRYIEQARLLDPEHFARRSFGERFMENTALLLGPLL